jgi:hypothetical protein
MKIQLTKNKLLSLLILLAGPVAASANCPSGTTATQIVLKGKNACELKGTYTSDLLLTNNNSYVLSGGVFIGGDNKNQSQLTIEPGTVVAGATGADFLVVNRGSKIIAEGKKNAPIIFTTSSSTLKRGSWGGLIINGNAPINCSKKAGAYCEAEGEGSTGLYGGNDQKDSSGILKYVIVEWAGYEITPENELNGIAFQGVGSGTIVDYIQVHKNADDGVEFFGGTVNIKHVVLTGNRDDSLDWTSGWVGKAQYVYIQQDSDEGNNGIEADNRKSPMNAEPRSNPVLSNLTMLGSETSRNGGSGVILRVGTGVKIYNTVVKGFKLSGVDVDDAETFNNGKAQGDDGVPGIHVTNSVFDNKVNFLTDANEADLSDWFLKGMNLNVMFGLEANIEESVKSVTNGAIKTGQVAVAVDDKEGFFEEVDYVGAIDPNGENWMSGWTTNAQ